MLQLSALAFEANFPSGQTVVLQLSSQSHQWIPQLLVKAVLKSVNIKQKSKLTSHFGLYFSNRLTERDVCISAFNFLAK